VNKVAAEHPHRPPRKPWISLAVDDAGEGNLLGASFLDARCGVGRPRLPLAQPRCRQHRPPANLSEAMVKRGGPPGRPAAYLARAHPIQRLRSRKPQPALTTTGDPAWMCSSTTPQERPPSRWWPPGLDGGDARGAGSFAPYNPLAGRAEIGSSASSPAPARPPGLHHCAKTAIVRQRQRRFQPLRRSLKHAPLLTSRG